MHWWLLYVCPSDDVMNSANDSPVHVVMLFIHDIFGLPLWRLLDSTTSIISFSRLRSPKCDGFLFFKWQSSRNICFIYCPVMSLFSKTVNCSTFLSPYTSTAFSHSFSLSYKVDTSNFENMMAPARMRSSCNVSETVAQSVVKSEGQGQSGQAIKLFQITPYVNYFQNTQQPRFLTACRHLEN